MFIAKCTSHVFNDSFRFHGAISADLSYFFTTIFLPYVINNFGSATFAKVNIEIRRRDTFGVEETFEKKVIFDGVNIGNTR